METRDFLFELGSEELPPKALLRLSQALQAHIESGLKKADLSFGGSAAFATPRRLAVLITGLSVKQPPRNQMRQGPSAKAAYAHDGTPTLALMGFARSCGVSLDQIETIKTPKGEYIQCHIGKPGQATAELLPEIVKHALTQLPIPKPMRWGNTSTTFVRPVQWALMLFGTQEIKMRLFDITTGRKTYGHRFLSPDAIELSHASDYVSCLKEAHVIADFNQRQQDIQDQIKHAASRYGKAVVDPALLDEVTALVEWPVVLVGEFNRRFLEVPQEALITSMKSHQKCFPVVNSHDELQPYFILVSNLKSKSPATVIKGNERVINARLSDADFFYRQDLKEPLAKKQKRLESVVFQHKLGSLADKAHRMSLLAAYIAKQINVDDKTAKHAALLAKCDLLTEMVGEFPSLQGIMGYYYANHDGESNDVALAIKEQYQPRFSGDAIASTPLSACVSLADKIDTLVGIIGIKQMPTGDKDPFALRRAALGIMRTLIETPLPLDLSKLIGHAIKLYKGALTNTEAQHQIEQFCMDRLRAWYADQGVSTPVFEAVLACAPKVPVDFDYRIKAVMQFQKMPECDALASANKRVRNILKKQADIKIPKALDTKLFESNAEAALAKALASQEKAIDTLYKNADYEAMLNQLSTLKTPVDQFFEEVMIMADDKKKRLNRLAILAKLRHLFTQVADISLLQ
jgi:glycyl-tRNA synthetase beta chain